jgi:hypothetical protein
VAYLVTEHRPIQISVGVDPGKNPNGSADRVRNERLREPKTIEEEL